MGRSARKRKRQTNPRSRAEVGKPKSSFSAGRRLLLACGMAAVVFVAIWYGIAFRSPQPSPEPALPVLPPEPPAIDVAAVLGLNESPPKDVSGMRGEVLSVCETLVRDLPDRPEAHSVAALTHYCYGLKDAALEAWRQAERLDDRFSPAQLGIGLVAAEQGHNKEAIAAFRRAIELNPLTEEAHAKLVEVLLRENQAEEALEAGQEFARRFPESRKATYWLGQAYLQLERYEDAVAAHEAVIRQHPDLTPSYYSLMVSLARLGRRDEAAETRAKFAELKEKDLQKERDQNRSYVDRKKQEVVLADTHLSAGNVYLHTGDSTKAEAHWLRGIQVHAEEVACRQSLAALYEAQERWRSLATVATELVELKSKDPAVWLQLAKARGRLGQLNEAEAAYRQAISLSPEETLAYVDLLRLCLQANRKLPDSVSLARKAVELAPSPDSFVLLSTVLEQSGDRDGALAAMEEAIRLAPDHPQLRQVYQQLLEDR